MQRQTSVITLFSSAPLPRNDIETQPISQTSREASQRWARGCLVTAPHAQDGWKGYIWTVCSQPSWNVSLNRVSCPNCTNTCGKQSLPLEGGRLGQGQYLLHWSRTASSDKDSTSSTGGSWDLLCLWLLNAVCRHNRSSLPKNHWTEQGLHVTESISSQASQTKGEAASSSRLPQLKLCLLPAAPAPEGPKNLCPKE